jgi:molybdopterin converting factor small subunit
MATVWIPNVLQALAGGNTLVSVEGRTVKEVIENLDARFPGFKERIVDDGIVRPDIAVAVDGELTSLGLYEKVGEASEVQFVPEIGGG